MKTTAKDLAVRFVVVDATEAAEIYRDEFPGEKFSFDWTCTAWEYDTNQLSDVGVFKRLNVDVARELYFNTVKELVNK